MRGAAGKMALDLEDDDGCAEPEVLVRRPLGAKAAAAPRNRALEDEGSGAEPEALPGRPPAAAAAADAPAPRRLLAAISGVTSLVANLPVDRSRYWQRVRAD